jgi:hypothetical protein
MISLFTSCIKRELYLFRLLESIKTLSAWESVPFEHFIVFQEEGPSDDLLKYINALPFSKSIKTGFIDKTEPVGAVLTSVVKKAAYPIFFKIDDDCCLMSRDFFLRVVETCAKIPQGVLLPAIVDGELYEGGGNPQLRRTIFLEKSNTYITVGQKSGASGKYIVPTEIARQVPFAGQKDAENMDIFAIVNHLPVYQSLNGLVIEIQDGFSGQHYRTKNQNGQKLA